jgi:hypothetical protein
VLRPQGEAPNAGREGGAEVAVEERQCSAPVPSQSLEHVRTASSSVFADNFPHIFVIVLSNTQSIAVVLFLDLRKILSQIRLKQADRTSSEPRS